jgi:hypothetical protein
MGVLVELATIRCVVTADKRFGNGVRSMIHLEQNLRPTLEPAPGLRLTELWKTYGSNSDLAERPESDHGAFALDPPLGGSLFRIVEFPPDAELREVDEAEMFARHGAAQAHTGQGERGPLMHRQDTVDYVIVLDGEIVAIMDDGEATLTAGDVLVQRGTNHGWSNRSDRSCTAAFILISARR